MRKLTLHGIDPPLTVTAVVRGLRDDDVSGPAARARSVGRCRDATVLAKLSF
jgi:hypothetical protein